MKKNLSLGKGVLSFALVSVLAVSELPLTSTAGFVQENLSQNENLFESIVSGNDISENDISCNDISGNDFCGISWNDIPNYNNWEKDSSGNDTADGKAWCDTASGSDISGDSISGSSISVNSVSDSDISGNDMTGYSLFGGKAASIIVDKASEGSLAQKPFAPEFGYGQANNRKITIYEATTSVKITAQSGCGIYYSLDGKNPTYKKGLPGSNTQKYSGTMVIGNRSRVVLKAIAVNAAGLCSSVMTQTFIFKPAVKKLVLSAPGSITTTNVETGTTTVSVNLVRGKKLQLKAAYTPEFAADKDLVWCIISAPGGAQDGVKISSKGKVTAGKNAVAGTYKICAMLRSNPKVKAVISVKLVNHAALTSLGRNKKAIELTTKGTTGTTYNLFPELKYNSMQKVTASDFVWKSSDTGIAIIAKAGVVKTVAGASGKAVISVTAKDGSGLTTSFTVKVCQQGTSVKITGDNKLGVGRSIRLTAIVAPKEAAVQRVKWEITKRPMGADERDVKIDAKGNIKASAKSVCGDYTVTAAALDGSGKSGTFVVTVQAAVKTVKLETDSRNLTLYRVSGGSTIGARTSMVIPVTAVTTDGKAAANLEVLSTEPGIVTASYNSQTKKVTITAVGAATGTATITCQAKDGSKKKDSIKITVVNPPSSITIQLPNGSMGDLAAAHSYKLSAVIGTKYGNPGKVKLEWSLETLEGGLTIHAKTGELKVPKELSASTIKLKVRALGDFSLTKSMSLNVKKPIDKLALRWGDSVIDKVPALRCNNEATLNIYVQDSDSTQSVRANSTSLKTTKSFEITSNSGNLNLVYSSTKKNVTISSGVKGWYKLTVKALDGTGIKKTYQIRIW